MPSRPNVLVLMSDHTNAAAMSGGGPCLTPVCDEIARLGRRFARCYTPNAICSPARASLMTGTYPSTHGMWDCTHTQRAQWVNVDERLTYFSQRLAEAGYRNGYFGKWHVEQTEQLEQFGWHEYDAKTGLKRLERVPGTEVSVKTPGYRDHLLAAAGRDDGDISHPAFNQGIDFIRRQADAEAPWCCFISALEPHDPYVAPQRFLDLYDTAAIPLPATLHEEDSADTPPVIRRMRQVWQGLSDEDWRRVRAAYWAVISYIDAEMGRVLDALRQTGQLDNTIIVVTSDHGDMIGSHGLVTKGIGTAYEEVYNIPLILRVPGLGGGEDATTCTSLVDVGPTLLDLCGAAPMEPCQGRSLRPVLEGTADPAEWQGAYAEFFGQRFVYTQRLVWQGDWKYVFSPAGLDELYNLAEDPHETNNRAVDPACREILEAMAARMWKKMAEIGDKSLSNSHYATLRLAPVGPESAKRV